MVKIVSEYRYLYKFRHFGDENHLRILTDHEVFFPSPVRFNDPFDSRVSPRYDQASREEVVAYWARFLKDEFPNETHERRQAMAEHVFDSGRFNTPEGLIAIKVVIEQFAQTKLGIFSLTPHFRNILMWSHYAQSHSGFVVGFLAQDLRNFALTYTVGQGQIMLLQSVRYNKTYPDLNVYRLSRREQFDGQFLTKAEDWAYESENRILLQEGANKRVGIPYDLVRRVILGCQINQPDKRRIIDILRARRDKPTLFQAVKSDRSFALQFKKLAY